MKFFIGFLIMIAGLLGGAYVGGWLMFVKPIIEVCKAYDAGTLTGLMVGIAVIKCLLAGAVGCTIFYTGLLIGRFFVD